MTRLCRNKDFIVGTILSKLLLSEIFTTLFGDSLYQVLYVFGIPRMQKLWARGYQRFPLSKPVVGRNIALHDMPTYMASTYLVSAFPAHSTSFSPNVSNPQRWNVYEVVNQNLYLWQEYILFRPSRLIGHKIRVSTTFNDLDLISSQSSDERLKLQTLQVVCLECCVCVCYEFII